MLYNGAMLVTQYPIILASQSPARQQLLSSVGLPFTVMASGYDEESQLAAMVGQAIAEQALTLARGKALAVSQQHPNAVVIAADQIGEFEGQPLAKPMSHDNAVALLQQLQGKDHQQHTAVCVYRDAKELWQHVVEATLSMRSLTPADIDAYLLSDQPYHCCGGYRYEGVGKHLFTALQGDADGVVGLPLLPLLNFLHETGLVSFSANSKPQ